MSEVFELLPFVPVSMKPSLGFFLGLIALLECFGFLTYGSEHDADSGT